MDTIIAKNVTAGPAIDLVLSQLSSPDSKIPASGQVELTLYNDPSVIMDDTQLIGYIQADQVVLIVNAVELTKDESLGYEPSHDLAGNAHNTATLAEFNVKISDANMDDSGDPRDPNAHDLSGAAHNATTLAALNAKVSDANMDDSGDPRDPTLHNLAGAEHSSTTLAGLNAKVSDANMDDAGASRPPTVHDLSGVAHGNTTLAALNAKITDATLDDSSSSRPPTGAAGGDLGGTYPNPTVDDGADGSAIHDDTAGEIAAISEKVTPVAADLIVIEDSEAGNAKKRAQVGNLPGGGGGGVVLQTLFTEATVDDSTTTINWGDTLLSQAITPNDAGNSCIVHMSVGPGCSIDVDVRGQFRIKWGETGSEVAKRATHVFCDASNENGSTAMVLKLPFTSANAHTCILEWKLSSSSSKTLYVRPVTQADDEHASLLLMEVSG